MKTFKESLKESDKGKFTTEVKTKHFDVEVNVNHAQSKIDVMYYKGRLLTPVKKEAFYSLHGMLGYESVEGKYNEIIKNLTDPNETVTLIRQKAIDLGFKFNESDAHDMYLTLKGLDLTIIGKIV